MRTSNLWHLLLNYCLFFMLLEVLVVSGVIAFHSFPFIDEFCYANDYINLGPLRFYTRLYADWSGRYFANLLFLFNPINFGSLNGFRIFSFLHVLLIPFIAYFPLKAEFPDDSRRLWMSLFAVTLLLFHYNRELFVTIMLFANAVSYSSGLMLFSLYYYFSQKADHRIWKRYFCYFLLFLLAGTAEQSIILVLAYLFIKIIWCHYNKKSIGELVKHFLFLTIVFLITYFASGNDVQHADRGFFKTKSIIDQLQSIIIALPENYNIPQMLWALVVAFLCGQLIGYGRKTGEGEISPTLFAINLSAAFATCFGLIFILSYAQGFAVSARQFYPLFFCLLYFIFINSLKLRILPSTSFCWWTNLLAESGVIFLLAVGTLNPMWQDNRRLLYSGVIQEYSAMLDIVYRDYYQQKNDRIPIPIKYVDLTYLYPHAGYMLEREGERVNFCSATYFGMDTIMFVDPEKKGGN